MNDTHLLVQLGQKALWIRDGRCLILEASERKGKWDLPGGRLHVGEKSEDGFKRELEEEIGLTDFQHVAVVDYYVWDREGLPTVCLVANVIASSEEKITLSHEHMSYKWVTREELAEHTFATDGMRKMAEKGFAYSERMNNEK